MLPGFDRHRYAAECTRTAAQEQSSWSRIRAKSSPGRDVRYIHEDGPEQQRCLIRPRSIRPTQIQWLESIMPCATAGQRAATNALGEAVAQRQPLILLFGDAGVGKDRHGQLSGYDRYERVFRRAAFGDKRRLRRPASFDALLDSSVDDSSVRNRPDNGPRTLPFWLLRSRRLLVPAVLCSSPLTTPTTLRIA